MKMKTNWKIGAIIGLVSIIALAALGITYAAGNSTYPAATTSKCGFSSVESNDDGATGSYGTYNPVDPGDNGIDPRAAQSPGVSCARVSSDIASTTATYTGDTISFTMNKIYPGYHPTVFFGLSNQSGTPGVVSSITLNNPDITLFTMTLNGIALKQTIDNGKEATGALDIGVGNVVPGQSYSFSATIVVTQSAQQGQNKCNVLLGSLPDPSDYGQPVTFGAAVISAGYHAIPTGTVTFMEGSTPIGTGTLDQLGLTSFTTTKLAVGSHTITAVYGGDSNFATNTSNNWVQKVRYVTSTTLASSLNPSTFGQTVKFTTTVKEQTPGTGTPTGNVTFYDGNNNLGTGTLSSGIATLNTSALKAGNHNITAQYNGDNNNDESNSNTVVQVVNKSVTGTTLTSSINPSVYGQAINFTAQVKLTSGSGTVTGSVTFKDGSTTLGTVSLSGGSASLSVSILKVGTHNITATYNGDGNGNTSTSNMVSQQVNKDSTKTVLTAAPNPLTYGQSVTFSATVAAVSPGSGIPSGSVTFKDGSSTLGAAVLSGGSATLNSNTLAVGTHNITAIYNGDDINGSYNTSASSAVSQKVNKANTVTVLSSSVNPSAFGQAVKFTASMTPNIATGSITFKDGSTTLGTIGLSSGSASINVSALTVGSHNITAVYSGDTNDAASASSILTQNVGKAATTTTLNFTKSGSTVNFTASMAVTAPGAGSATGTVAFKDGTTTIATMTISGGKATFSKSNLSGHSITAVYSGDGNFGTSTSNVVKP